MTKLNDCDRGNDLYWWQIQNQSTWYTAPDDGVTLGYPGGSSRMTVMGIMVRNGCTYRVNNTAVYQWIYAYSCLAGKRHYLLCFYFFFLPLPLGLFPWDSYQFVLILPRPVVVVRKLRCRHGKKMCACMCVCVCFCQAEGERALRRKRRKSEAAAKVAGAREVVWVSFHVTGRVSSL